MRFSTEKDKKGLGSDNQVERKVVVMKIYHSVFQR